MPMQMPIDEVDGLTLLQQHRPAVVEAYMRLLGSLGSGLDPRVKQLILIALQTTQGSSRALRRHIPRALEAGATAGEVLDAISLALPVAGLTRTTEVLTNVADLLAVRDGPAA
jgi:alkylhydroperoxidase/carboxymuconolactone decarboxylase family protein YurZ